MPLPTIADVATMPATALLAFITQLAALQTAAAMRLAAAITADSNDCEAFDAEEAARRLGCSVDLLREHGVAWGIALVLARDRDGRPTAAAASCALGSRKPPTGSVSVQQFGPLSRLSASDMRGRLSRPSAGASSVD